jgi:hypothetical protein
MPTTNDDAAPNTRKRRRALTELLPPSMVLAKLLHPQTASGKAQEG